MTVISEVQTGSGAVAAFYKGMAEYLNSTGVEVDISTLDGTLKYEDLLTYVRASAQQGGSFAVGLGIEALSDFAAIQRELDLSRLTKTQLMSSAAGEASSEAQIYSDTATYQVGVLSGSSTTGSQA
jgi:hypothetical protein